MIIKRKKIHLECLECKTRNYTLTRGDNPTRPKLEVKKYCKYCQKHTDHRESK